MAATSSSRARGFGVPGSSEACSSSSWTPSDTASPTGTSRAAAAISGRSRRRRVPLVRIENGVPAAASARENAGHQPVAALGPLVRVGVRAERHVLTAPGRPGELPAQHLGHVDLHDDLAVEVGAGVELEPGVRSTGEAVDAGVRAAAVGIDRPAERHGRGRRHLVERAPRGHLVEADPGELGGGDRAEQAGDALEAGQRARHPRRRASAPPIAWRNSNTRSIGAVNRAILRCQ